MLNRVDLHYLPLLALSAIIAPYATATTIIIFRIDTAATTTTVIAALSPGNCLQRCRFSLHFHHRYKPPSFPSHSQLNRAKNHCCSHHHQSTATTATLLPLSSHHLRSELLCCRSNVLLAEGSNVSLVAEAEHLEFLTLLISYGPTDGYATFRERRGLPSMKRD